MTRRLAGAALLAAAALAFGCGGDESPRESRPSASTSASTSAEPPPPKSKVRLAVRRLARSTMDSQIVVRGTVTPGASVTVRGQRARVRRGRFRVALNIRVGSNRFTAVARHADRRTVRKVLRVRRQLPPPPPPPPPPPVAPAACPPHFTPAPGGCAPADNEAYDSIPANPGYDHIPETPVIDGE